MKNTDFEIRFVLKSGWTQTWYKTYDQGPKSWRQITNGVERKCTAEQVLNHLLPGLMLEKMEKLDIEVVKKGDRIYMRCPLLKRKNGADCCKFKGDCPLLKRYEKEGKDCECLDLSEEDYRQMELLTR